MSYKIDPKKQFSKRLARWTAVFWFVYMAWLSIIMFLVPEAALYTIYMGIIVSVVMILNVISYTKNSITEKIAFAMLDKTKLELKLGSSKLSVGNTNEEESEDGGNG